MSVTIICPFCGAKGELDEFQEGAKVNCPSCGKDFVLDVFSVFQGDETSSPSASKNLKNDASDKPDSQTKAVESIPPKDGQTMTESNDGKEKAAPVSTSMSGNASAEIKPLQALVILMIIMMGFMCLLMMNINSKLNALSPIMMNINSKLDALSPKDNPIISTKLIDYTWEYPTLMKAEFDDAVQAGYEPAGYVCQNSIKGGFFLFIKRKTNGTHE